MTEYCTECGGRPHPEDGGETGQRHPMKWGRMTPPRPIYAEPEIEVKPEDGPIEVIEAMPDAPPKNAQWLIDNVPAKQLRVVESRGYWKGGEERVVGVAGICERDVRFYASWKWSWGQSKWVSREHWVREGGSARSVGWRELKEVLDELGRI